MSRKPKNIDEPFSPEQLERLETKGDKDVQLQRQKEGIFQRNRAKSDAQDLASDVRWKRRAGIALVTLLGVLFLLWMVTWLLTTIGDLVITVDSAAARKGITISSSADGTDSSTKLSAMMVPDVTNITYDWLPGTLDIEADGSHNGKNYLAYTFYLTNNGKDTLDYQSTLKSVKAAKDADEAIRIMVYRNAEPDVFAKENRGLTSSDGSPEPFEKIFKKEVPENYTPPTAEELEKAAEAPQNKELVAHTDEEIEIQQFVDSKTVFNTEVKGLEPGQTDKYTIVMWVEGEDPECLDVIRGGYVKLMWFFNIADEEL